MPHNALHNFVAMTCTIWDLWSSGTWFDLAMTLSLGTRMFSTQPEGDTIFFGTKLSANTALTLGTTMELSWQYVWRGWLAQFEAIFVTWWRQGLITGWFRFRGAFWQDFWHSFNIRLRLRGRVWIPVWRLVQISTVTTDCCFRERIGRAWSRVCSREIVL